MPYLLLTLAALFLGRELCCRARAGAGRGSDPDDRSALGALTALLLGLLYRRQIAGSRRLLRANAPAVVVLTLCGRVSFRSRSILACKPPPRSTPPSICPPRRAWYC